jgi:hypothetical protein
MLRGMQEFSRTPPVALSHAHPLRVVHQIPQRVRLRPHTGRWTPHQRERVTVALRRTSGVQSYRISHHSLTVHHSAPLHAVIDCVQHAIAEPQVPHADPLIARTAPAQLRQPAVLAPRQPAAIRSPRRRAAGRLLACAAVSLAIALLPQPVAPAMIILRLLACAITAGVRYHAETLAEPCTLTRLLDALASVVGLARADNLFRALFKHCVEAVLKRWLQARLRQTFA